MVGFLCRRLCWALHSVPKGGVKKQTVSAASAGVCGACQGLRSSALCSAAVKAFALTEVFDLLSLVQEFVAPTKAFVVVDGVKQELALEAMPVRRLVLALRPPVATGESSYLCACVKKEQVLANALMLLCICETSAPHRPAAGAHPAPDPAAGLSARRPHPLPRRPGRRGVQRRRRHHAARSGTPLHVGPNLLCFGGVLRVGGQGRSRRVRRRLGSWPWKLLCWLLHERPRA